MIPTWIERKASDELVTEIMRQMKLHHTGIDNAGKKHELVHEFFGVAQKDKAFNDAERLFRRCVELANTEHGGLIVSDTVNGYWWAASLEDGMSSAEKNMARAATIMNNARAVLDNIKAEYGGQIRMM